MMYAQSKGIYYVQVSTGPALRPPQTWRGLGGACRPALCPS